MPIIGPLFIADQTSVVWEVEVDNQGLLSATIAAGVLTPVNLQDIVTGISYIFGIFSDPGANIFQFILTPSSTPATDTQAILTDPSGSRWGLQISNGLLQTIRAQVITPNCAQTIAFLGTSVQDRLEEPRGVGIFWDRSMEVYSALIEAINDLLLMVGRPFPSTGGGQVTGYMPYEMPWTLTPNTVWQPMPTGVWLVTDIQGPSSPIWRVSLQDMDYLRGVPEWENETSQVPDRWFPVGMNLFGVHPAPSMPLQVILTTIAYPTTNAWPYNGSEFVPFHAEFESCLEMYAASYLRLKEGGMEFSEGVKLYQNYLELAQRLLGIEDRKDPILFTQSSGGLAGINALRAR